MLVVCTSSDEIFVYDSLIFPLQAGLVTYFNGVINMKKVHYSGIQLLNSIEEESGQVRS